MLFHIVEKKKTKKKKTCHITILNSRRDFQKAAYWRGPALWIASLKMYWAVFPSPLRVLWLDLGPFLRLAWKSHWDIVLYVILVSTNKDDFNLDLFDIYSASTSSNLSLSIAGCSTLIIELLLHHPSVLWRVFKHLPSGLLKLFNAFYSNFELDESGTNSLDITAEFQRTPAPSSSANLKRRYLNQSVTQQVFQNSNDTLLKKNLQ